MVKEDKLLNIWKVRYLQIMVKGEINNETIKYLEQMIMKIKHKNLWDANKSVLH